MAKFQAKPIDKAVVENLKNRARKVNIDNATLEQVDMISAQIAEKLGEIAERANVEANKILAIYGLETKMQMSPPVPLGTYSKPT